MVTQSQTKSDIELVSEVREGNRKSFAELVERHQRSLLRLSLRFTREQSLAEDVVQESFIKAFQKIHLFEGRSSFKSWLYQIALNTARNNYRDRGIGGRAGEAVDLETVPLGVDPGAESGMVRADVRKIFRAEIDRLPDRQRIALTLRIFEDLSFKEVAEIMECPYDTAKANYRHAIMKLKERIEDMDLAQNDMGSDLAWMQDVSNAIPEVEA